MSASRRHAATAPPAKLFTDMSLMKSAQRSGRLSRCTAARPMRDQRGTHVARIRTGSPRTGLKGTETRIRPVTRSFFELPRPASPPRPRWGIQTVHRARHLFREQQPATPAPMSHLPSQERSLSHQGKQSPGSDQPNRARGEALVRATIGISAPFKGDEERRPPTPRKDPADRGHEQAVAAPKTRSANLALEDHQLVAKDHQLDLGGSSMPETLKGSIREWAGRRAHKPFDSRSSTGRHGAATDPTNAPVECSSRWKSQRSGLLLLLGGSARALCSRLSVRTCVVRTRA